jgi:hypothetical protein
VEAFAGGELSHQRRQCFLVYCRCLPAKQPDCSWRCPAGTFADKVSRQTAAATSLAASVADQIAVRQTESKTQSHTAGFEVRGPLSSPDPCLQPGLPAVEPAWTVMLTPTPARHACWLLLLLLLLLLLCLSVTGLAEVPRGHRRQQCVYLRDYCRAVWRGQVQL